ncbi:NAD(P)/FAD-dependent oxidoreductase [Spirosoma montaniterrae]|uniref:Pyridine nucleotide-disulfide oxidoreductase n=1 Tax=Spirosoma montaniterrae TaxID=1178516 RepID=A0A1P9WR96_9BACT|nr:NAD(P)/FAD-dependent oxidoreductase [Spirosoma montaniterrae]AQG77883.1 pyridine nucleotide-disulfide oxidoreductase [Spirosoma montaniterrae]
MESTDVLIIGGSYAGLSAALTLARSLRQVLVIDAGQPCNRQTPHSHNFITHDGTPPALIADRAREQVLAYPTVSFVHDFATEAARINSGFVVTTQSGRQYKARKVLLATGVVDQLPVIDGLAECWGISALHCPYCHGYEVAGQRIGVLANGDLAVEMVRLIQQWSKQVTLFTNGPATFSQEQKTLFQQLNVPVAESPVLAVVHQEGQVQHLQLADGSAQAVDALFVRPVVAHRNPLAEQLGCESNDMKLIQANEFGQTNVPGLYVAGDNSFPLRAVSVAVANGMKAGSFVNRELIEEDLIERLGAD